MYVSALSLQDLHELSVKPNFNHTTPSALINHSPISITQLSAADTNKLKQLYHLLQTIYQFLKPQIQQTQVAGFTQQFKTFLKQQSTKEIMSQFHSFGMDLKNHEIDLEMRKALHDIRGGSLVALFMHLELFLLDEAYAEEAVRVFILTRDHLKIMRNAVFDIDPIALQQDSLPLAHGVHLIEEKWKDTYYHFSGRTIQVLLECYFKGDVSECCMEFSALDRVIYNLINNAAKFALDEKVHFCLFPLNAQENTQVRFVIYNQISEEHQQTLKNKFGQNLAQLFLGGFTTGGHGVGMRICADFVVHGYGLENVQHAIDEGYLGIKLVQDYFVVWFHWAAKQVIV